jgi:anaerobic ribonucleoside-triphosphate reductase activating protein
LINSLIRELNYIDGISFSGGDPFDQCDNFYKFAKKIKAYKLNIWCWTGYTFEQLLELGKKKRGIKKLLELIDVIVDGRFIEKLKSNNCKYRGSTNQRIIDVKKSLQYKKTILFKIN